MKNIDERSNILKEYQKNGKPTTIVVGASLAGLSSAFSLSLRNHNVLVIDNRGEYTRNQLIFISEELIGGFYNLSELPKFGITYSINEFQFELIYPQNFEQQKNEALKLDLDFFKLLEKKHCAIPIKELQKYQLSKFKTMLAHQKTFSYPVETEGKTKNFNLKGQVAFFCGSQYEVLAIDGKTQTLQLKTSDSSSNPKGSMIHNVPFDHFIAADGSKHEMANLLAQNKAYKMQLKDLPSPKHNAYGSITLRLANNNGQLSKIPFKTITSHTKKTPRLKESDLRELKTLGWDKNYVPIIYLNISETQNECYITGEIPSGCLTPEVSLKTREALLTHWFSTIAGLLLNIKSTEFSAIENTFSTHQVQTQHFEENHITLGKRGKFILVGDAWLPANFLFGHGARSAIEDGNIIDSCFNSKGKFISVNPLIEHAVKRLDQYYAYAEEVEEFRITETETLSSLSEKESILNEEVVELTKQLNATTAARSIKKISIQLQLQLLDTYKQLTDTYVRMEQLHLRDQNKPKSNSWLISQTNAMSPRGLQPTGYDLIWLEKMYNQQRKEIWKRKWETEHGENCQDMYAVELYKSSTSK